MSRWTDWKIVSEEPPQEDEVLIAANVDGDCMIGLIQKSHDASETGYTCYSNSEQMDDVIAWTEIPPFYLPEIYEIWRASVHAEN